LLLGGKKTREVKRLKVLLGEKRNGVSYDGGGQVKPRSGLKKEEMPERRVSCERAKLRGTLAWGQKI